MQLFLSHNRQNLQAEGICYPIAPEPTSFAHHGMPWVYIHQYIGATDRPGNFTFNDALSAFKSSGCHTLLLSSEDFLNCVDYQGFLPEFNSLLRSHFDKIVVTAFVRGRKRFLSSSYNEWVKSLVYAHDFQSYLDRVTKGKRAPIHYTRALLAWAEIADTAIYTPFKPATFTMPIQDVFLENLGISKATIDGFEPFSSVPLNTSIGPKSVFAYRQLKQRLDQFDWFDPYRLQQREALSNFLQAYTDQQGWNCQPFRVFTKERLATVNAVFGKEDQDFANAHFAADWQDIFQDEHVPEKVTEIVTSPLKTEDRLALERLVELGIQKAADIYNSSV